MFIDNVFDQDAIEQYQRP